jgi:hypothetical protein
LPSTQPRSPQGHFLIAVGDGGAERDNANHSQHLSGGPHPLSAPGFPSILPRHFLAPNQPCIGVSSSLRGLVLAQEVPLSHLVPDVVDLSNYNN